MIWLNMISYINIRQSKFSYCSIFCSCVVFSILGYMAHSTNRPVDQVNIKHLLYQRQFGDLHFHPVFLSGGSRWWGSCLCCLPRGGVASARGLQSPWIKAITANVFLSQSRTSPIKICLRKKTQHHPLIMTLTIKLTTQVAGLGPYTAQVCFECYNLAYY